MCTHPSERKQAKWVKTCISSSKAGIEYLFKTDLCKQSIVCKYTQTHTYTPNCNISDVSIHRDVVWVTACWEILMKIQSRIKTVKCQSWIIKNKTWCFLPAWLCLRRQTYTAAPTITTIIRQPPPAAHRRTTKFGPANNGIITVIVMWDKREWIYSHTTMRAKNKSFLSRFWCQSHMTDIVTRYLNWNKCRTSLV